MDKGKSKWTEEWRGSCWELADTGQRSKFTKVEPRDSRRKQAMSGDLGVSNCDRASKPSGSKIDKWAQGGRDRGPRAGRGEEAGSLVVTGWQSGWTLPPATALKVSWSSAEARSQHPLLCCLRILQGPGTFGRTVSTFWSFLLFLHRPEVHFRGQ